MIAVLLIIGILASTGQAWAAEIIVTWKDNTRLEEGFIVERKAPDGEFTVIARTAPDVTSFTDAVQPAERWCYQVSAFRGDEYTAATNTVCASTQGALVPPDGIKIQVNP